MRLGMFFTRSEYLSRWQRVQAAMAAAGYENLLVWQRSAGTYDKVVLPEGAEDE